MDLKIIKPKCHWCSGSFKRVDLPGLRPYLCSNEVCAKKQMEGAIWVNKSGEGNRCVYVPTPRGRDFELLETRNGLMGGAAGGSKSHTLRWLGHRFCLKYPGYRCLLIRDKLTELKTTHVQGADVGEGLENEQAILPFVYNHTDMFAKYENGSILRLGHMENITQYLSTSYDLILADELVTLPEREMRLLMSRTERKSGVQGGFRAGTNPGGREAAWVKRYFVDKDVDPQDDYAYRPEDYAYIPSTVEDNPYLNPLYINRLLGLPEDLREAYLYGNWDIFPGQFFTEWRNRTRFENGKIVQTQIFSHVIPKYDISTSYKRICSIDWGFVKPGIAGWFVMLPDGHAVLEDEYVFQRTQAPDVAKEIARRTKSRGLTRIHYVGDNEMWGPNNDSGEATERTFSRFGVSMSQASKDRKNGWVRLRAWFRAAPDGKPWLQVMDHCKYTVRTMPSQVMDETDPEDIDHKSQTDHPADMARYWSMSNPSPDESARISVYAHGTVGALKEEVKRSLERTRRLR